MSGLQHLLLLHCLGGLLNVSDLLVVVCISLDLYLRGQVADGFWLFVLQVLCPLRGICSSDPRVMV